MSCLPGLIGITCQSIDWNNLWHNLSVSIIRQMPFRIYNRHKTDTIRVVDCYRVDFPNLKRLQVMPINIVRHCIHSQTKHQVS